MGERMIFAGALPVDEKGNGLRFPGMLQEREIDGEMKDEPYLPMVMYERQISTGLYLPPGTIEDNDDVGMPRVESKQIGSKASSAVVVTPDDSSDLAQTPTSGIYVGLTGDIKVDMESGDTVTFTAIKSGVVYPFKITRVYETDTTADNIIALY